MFNLDLEKVEQPEIRLPTSIGSSKKQESSRKPSTSALLTMPKPLTVWITTNCVKFLKMGIPDHLTCLLRNLYADQKQQLEVDTKQQTGSKSRKEYIKAEYCHPAYLTSMQSTGSGRSPGERIGYPLQYSCPENPMDRGTWQATVHGVAKSWTQLSDFHFHFLSQCQQGW